MNIQHYTQYYFIGIGGIGMSALARYFKRSGKEVLGYDKTETELTKELQSEGILITYYDDYTTIPSAINAENTLVIYTPAIPKDSILLNFFSNNGFEVIKRSKVLGEITKGSFSICVAGTHGKTTTSTLVGHLFKLANQPATAFLGGISENYESNFIYNGTEISIIEADEFDRSFLTLSPNFACITSTDADHLDIYGEKEALLQSFNDFANLVPSDGTLFVRKGLQISAKHSTYAVNEVADYSAQNIRIAHHTSIFDLQTPTELIADFVLPIPGNHNIENATVALAMALEKGISAEVLKEALRTFKGIHRRFAIHHLADNRILIDDYAHHPTELKAVMSAVRSYFPNQKMLTVFQPHLFTRTRDFADDFAVNLANTDELVLLDIYPAREKPIEGITSEWLCEKINIQSKKVCSLTHAIAEIQKSDFEVLLIVGAGDIDTLVKPIIEIYS